MAKKRKRGGLLIVLGLVGSLVWVGLAYLYVTFSVGWTDFWSLKPNEHGDFMAGFFAPLALGWFVLTLMLQGQQIGMQAEELELQREELRETRKTLEAQRVEMEKAADQAVVQAEAIRANELHARRDTLLRVIELTRVELVSIVGRLLVCSTEEGRLDRIWRHFGRGESDALFSEANRQLMGGRRSQYLQTWRGVEDWPQPAEAFCEKYQRLIGQAQDCDPDGHLRDHLESSQMGKLYRALCEILKAELGTEIRASEEDTEEHG